jgi:hypothetical protein
MREKINVCEWLWKQHNLIMVFERDKETNVNEMLKKSPEIKSKR